MPGPFYFAWEDEGIPFAESVQAREDETIFSFTVEQSEGDFATLHIQIINPNIGLLSAGRKQWAWLSWYNGSEIIPLFYGRLVGIPTDINQRIVSLVFVARPSDFVAQKGALADTLKDRPYYDPVWIADDQIENPDTVLEARAELWAIDRVTHAVTASDILFGEDGNESFVEDDVPRDSVQINLTQTPLRAVSVEGKVTWTQTAQGTVNFGHYTVDTYTGKSLINGWPKPGTSLQSGWTVVAAQAVDAWDVANVKMFSAKYDYQNPMLTHENGDVMSVSSSKSWPNLRSPYLYYDIITSAQMGTMNAFADPPYNIPASSAVSTFYIAQSRVNTSLVLGYAAARARTERIKFTLKANVQALITMPDGADALQLSLSGADVGNKLVTGELPIVNNARGAYFTTDRGLQSLEYLISLARANLLIRSRAVEITWDCKFIRAIALSLRKNATLADHRLPGHSAVGKIIRYRFGLDGSTGKTNGSVTIGCAIGYGGVVVDVEGEPDYCETDYVEAGYQMTHGGTVSLPSADVGYSEPAQLPNDDGLKFPLSKWQVVIHEQWHGPDSQEELITLSFLAAKIEADLARDTMPSIETQGKLAAAQSQNTESTLKNYPIWYDLLLKPVNGGPFETIYNVDVSQLELPKMIDLEAAT